MSFDTLRTNGVVWTTIFYPFALIVSLVELSKGDCPK